MTDDAVDVKSADNRGASRALPAARCVACGAAPAEADAAAVNED
jgi:hypothetical protein